MSTSSSAFWRPPRLLWGAFAVAVVLRAVAAGFQPISHDAAAFYLPNARALFEGGLGNWQGMTIAVPPLFPTLTAMLAHLAPISDSTSALEWSALFISVVAGAALVWPVFALAREFFPRDPRVPTWSVIFVAMHPYLVQFGGDARADSLYTLLFTLSILLGWRTYRDPRPRWGGMFGVTVGLAYLLRPEALGLPLLLTVGVLLGLLQRRHGDEWRNYGVRVLVAGVCGFVLLIPALGWNVAFVHSKIGILTLSPKAGVLMDYDKGEDVFGELNAAKTMTLKEEKLTDPNSYQSFSLVQMFGEQPGRMLTAMARNLASFGADFPEAFSIPGTLFLAISIATLWVWRRRRAQATRRQRQRHQRLRSELAPHVVWVPVMVIGFYSLTISMFYLSSRYWVPHTPMLIVFCAFGIERLAQLRMSGRIIGAVNTLFVLCVLTLPQTLYAAGVGKYPWRGSADLEMGGRWADTLRGEWVVSVKGKFTWYVAGRHLNLPTSSQDPNSTLAADVAIYMRHRGAKYLLLDHDRAHRGHMPELWETLKLGQLFVEVDRQRDRDRDLRLLELK